MAPAEKLPSYLVGEILCRLPTKSLARFRAVSKTWNAFWGDKSFLEKYLARARPQFIVWTNSQICSVGIDDDDDDPRLEVRDIITSDISSIQASLVHCDGFLLSSIWKKGFEVWNPCLRRRKRFVENHEFRFCGLGYDNSRPETETTGYKIFGYDFCFDTSGQLYQNVAIYDCKSGVFKIISNAPCEQDLGVPQLDTMVSLNGNLYWIAYHSVARQYFIRSFDFAKEMFKTFCLLPYSQQQQQDDFGYTQVLAVFRGDRFSVLRQSYMTSKIVIFVTKHKIDGNGEAVAWMRFMTVSIPDFPRLKHKCLDAQPSYFVDNEKRLFVCTCDETGHACIYIVKGDVFRKIPLGSMVGHWPSHLTYIPTFTPIPFTQRSEKLPSELVGEILCRLPRKALAQSRAVCKPWNALWEDKSFLKNYLACARPQFILRTNSKIFSVDIINLDNNNPILEMHDITSDMPCTNIVHCDGFLLSSIWKKGFVVWNPWLRQKRLIENQEFRFCGLGYDNSRPKTTGYKVFGVDFCFDGSGKLYPKVAIYECNSDAWKFIVNAPSEHDWGMPQLDTIISLAGNLYWIAYHSPTREYFIRSFDFSKEMFNTFCLLPPNEQDFGYTQVLAVFRGDRFSVLRQSYMTSKIVIFVTKHKIDGNGEAVAWMRFMTVSMPDFPRLQHKCLDSQPIYFVDNEKRLFVCTCDETGHACIYIVKGDVFCKIPVDDSMVDLWPSHLTYIPSFIPIPFELPVSHV